MLDRREFVKMSTVGMGVVAVGGGTAVGVWDRVTQAKDSGDAWAQAEGVDRMLLAATLAANSHNTQPWAFRLGSNYVDLLGDAGRAMGEADPRRRELHVSLGCALENLVIEAAAQDVHAAVDYNGTPPSTHLARISLTPGGSLADDARLAEAIPTRRTNRGPYDLERGVARESLDAFAALVEGPVQLQWLTNPDDCARFTDLSIKATEAHVAHEVMQRDSHRWYRMKRSDAEETHEGITVEGANLPIVPRLALGLFPPTPESFDAGWVTATAETHCGTAPAYGLLTIESAGDHTAWVEAGRAFQRVQLAATLEGLALHPISQALAIRDRALADGEASRFESELEAMAGGKEVVLAFRIGYPMREQSPSLRREPVIENG